MTFTCNRRVALELVGVALVVSLVAGCGSTKGPAKVDAGNTSDGDAASVPGSDKAAIGAKVFDDKQVLSYYLTISDEEYARLVDLQTLLLNQYTVNEDRYVRAALRVGDTELPAVAVRYKGNYSIWGCVDFATGERVSRVEPVFGNVDVCQRFSLKLDIDRYDSTARLDGLKKVNLHAMAADPSKLRERLGYSLFRDAGLLASRAVHARVYINGVYHGLFAAVEQVDGRFTANRFPEAGDGNLFRDVWPAPGLGDGAVEEALRTNDDPGTMDVSDFLAMRDAVASSTDADFATKLAPFVDFDELARYLVVDRAIANFDGILAFYFGSGWGPQNANYYWYDTGGGRFTLIPWDFDKTFLYPEPNFWSDNAPNGGNVVPNWNVVTDGCTDYASSFDAVVTYNGVARNGTYGLKAIPCDPFLRRLRGVIYDRQKAIADTFLAGAFSDAAVTAKLDAWRAQIADAIAEDPLVDSTQWQSAVVALRETLPKLRANLALMMSGLIQDSTGGTGDAGAGGPLTIEVTDIDAAYEGKSVYVRLQAGGSLCQANDQPGLYLGQGTVTGGASKVVIPDVLDGAYTSCGLIDANDDAQPGPGDVAGVGSLTMPGDADTTWSALSWTPL